MIVIREYSYDNDGWVGKMTFLNTAIDVLIHEQKPTDLKMLKGKIVTFKDVSDYKIHDDNNGFWLEIWVPELMTLENAG